MIALSKHHSGSKERGEFYADSARRRAWDIRRRWSMKIPNRAAVKHSARDNKTFATVKSLTWPAQLFWTVVGHTASTIRAIMNVKVPLCRWPLSVILQAKEIVGVPRCCHGWKGIMIPDTPGQETQSMLVCRGILVLIFSTSAQAHVWYYYKLTLWWSPEKDTMVTVEQINAKDAWRTEQAMKNQHAGLTWVDSLNDMATKPLR